MDPFADNDLRKCGYEVFDLEDIRKDRETLFPDATELEKKVPIWRLRDEARGLGGDC